MENFKPMTVSELNELYEVEQDRIRTQKIQSAVASIYTSVVNAAKNGKKTFSTSTEYLDEVLTRIKSLFPDANIERIIGAKNTGGFQISWGEPKPKRPLIKCERCNGGHLREDCWDIYDCDHCGRKFTSASVCLQHEATCDGVYED